MGSFVHVGDRKPPEMSAGKRKRRKEPCDFHRERGQVDLCLNGPGRHTDYPSLTKSLEKVEALHTRIGVPPVGRTYCAILIDIHEVNAIKDVLELARITLERKKA